MERTETMSDLIETVDKLEQAEAIMSSIDALIARGIEPPDAFAILLKGAVVVAQMQSTMTREFYMEAVAREWDQLAARRTPGPRAS
jgi:hypothetical protein